MDAITPRETLAAGAVASGAGNLAAAIAAIMARMEAVPKLGVNDFHKFTFARMPDLMRIVAPLMAQHGIVVLQSEVGHELIAEGVLRVEFDFDIVHAPSGEVRTIRSSGMAKVAGERGGFNDRAIQAIATTTRKYVLIALFGVVVDDLPDVDHAERSEHAAARRKARPSKTNAAPVFNQLRSELDAIASVGDLQEWGDTHGVTIATLPADWQKALRFRYSEKLAELRPAPATPPRTAKTVAPAPKHSLKSDGIAERAMRAMEARQFGHRSQGPSQPFSAPPMPPEDESTRLAREMNRRIYPMNDELPGDLGPPKPSGQVVAVPADDDGLGIPPMFDRRKAKAAGAAWAQEVTERTYADL